VIPALLALALAASPAPSEPPRRQVLERVAATVNGEVITLRELQDRGGEEWRRAEKLPAGLERDQAARRVLRRTWEAMVAERLFHAQAVTLQLDVADGQVAAAIDDIKRRNRFDDTQLDLALAGQGLDRAAFKVQIRRELESMQVLGYRVRSRIKVTDEDVQNYYRGHPGAFGGEEELHVHHLFLPLPESASPAAVAQAQAEAQQLVARLTAGEDFAALARQASRGSAAEHGGDLGWVKRGDVQKQLEEGYVGLRDGQVSKPIRVGAGLHVFKVEGRRLAGGRTFEQAKDEIRDLLVQEQTASYRDQYVAELKRDAVIDIRLPELKD
jgi:peptidyl-prolyl cis-trans isomerase SurA